MAICGLWVFYILRRLMLSKIKNYAKFTRTYLHRSLFSTCNLQLYWKKDTSISVFSVKMFSAKYFRNNFITEKLLWTGFERRILRKMVKWITKSIVKATALSKNRYFDRKCIFHRYFFSKVVCWNIFLSLTVFRKNIWECFKVQLSVAVSVYFIK